VKGDPVRRGRTLVRVAAVAVGLIAAVAPAAIAAAGNAAIANNAIIIIITPIT